MSISFSLATFSGQLYAWLKFDGPRNRLFCQMWIFQDGCWNPPLSHRVQIFYTIYFLFCKHESISTTEFIIEVPLIPGHLHSDVLEQYPLSMSPCSPTVTLVLSSILLHLQFYFVLESLIGRRHKPQQNTKVKNSKTARTKSKLVSVPTA